MADITAEPATTTLLSINGQIPGSTVVASGRTSPWWASGSSRRPPQGAIYLLFRREWRRRLVHYRRWHHLAQPVRRVLPPVGGGRDRPGSLRAERDLRGHG